MTIMTAADDLPRLRPADTTDADDLFRMARLLATTAVPEREPFDRSLLVIIGDHRQHLVVADTGTGLVGYLYGLVHPAFHANGNIGWVEELFVDPDTRGSGLGRRLMAAFEAWAQQSAQVQYIGLATRRAGDFYRAIGYQESATYFKRVTRQA